jgi:hypothetical protein
VVGGERLDRVGFLGIFEACPGALIELPTEPRYQPRGAEEAGRILDESVVAHQAQLPGFDVRNPVEGIHQQTVRMLVERQGHGIGGEVAAAEIFENRVPVVYRLAGLGVFLPASARNLDCDTDRETEEQGP